MNTGLKHMKQYLLPKDGNFYKANLHCHTVYSDGNKTPEEIKTAYQQRGYSVVAYTDHELLIPHCYRIFEGPAHGWGLGGGTAAEGWVEEAAAFWMEHSGRPHKK
jgi:histidinol phosphatase-like PHP family hydrolase